MLSRVVARRSAKGPDVAELLTPDLVLDPAGTVGGDETGTSSRARPGTRVHVSRRKPFEITSPTPRSPPGPRSIAPSSTPRRQERMRPSTAGESLATRSMPRSWPKATTPSATRSSSTTGGTAWMRACCSSRSPAFCRRTTRASWARSTRSSRRSARGPSSGATRRRTAWTGLPAVKGHFSSAAYGW